MNVAFRLRALVDDWQSVDQTKSMTDGWCFVLKFNGPAHEREEIAMDATKALRTQVTELHDRMMAMHVPNSAIEACVGRLRNAFSAGQLNGGWQGMKDSVLSAEVRIPLEWAAWALETAQPEREEALDPEILAALFARVAEQEALLDSAKMPHSISDMLRRHVTEFKAALRLYKVQGVGPLQAAVAHAYGDFATASPATAAAAENLSPESSGVLSKGMKLVGEAAQVADKLTKIAKFSNDVYHLAIDNGSLLLGWIKNS